MFPLDPPGFRSPGLSAPHPADPESRSVAHLLRGGRLAAHYQPIVRLRDGQVAAHESLIRLPQDGALRQPDDLFRAAREQNLTLETERACLDVGLRGWLEQGGRGRLFLNLSARTIVLTVDRLGIEGVLAEFGQAGVVPSAIVIEVTEHEYVTDMARLVAIARQLAAHGVHFALDDFGDGRSSLRLWAELRPEFVKIDKYFSGGIEANPVKVQTVRGLARLAETFGTQLVAEGIETDGQLRVLRDLGIEYGQGYFLGRPAPTLRACLPDEAEAVIRSADIAVLPELTRAAGSDVTVARVAHWVDPVPVHTTVNELAARFSADASLRAVALVDGERPVGLLNRQSFVDSYARPYFKELFGRKSCLGFANTAPLVLDRNAGIDAMTAVLTAADQSYLKEGFVVTEGGRYAGIGTGEQLVRIVTEVRIEAARHANPLTFLPGNIPISEHIGRLLRARRQFVACYVDLNDFKPFNDHYGYWQGDEVIRLIARTLVAHCDGRRDFVGHVGGDDFVLLFQSEDWLERCREVIAAFNQRAVELYDAPARAAGGIVAEDRQGVSRFFPFTTVAMGALVVRPGRFERPEGVANAAAMAKHQAKLSRSGLYVEQVVPPHDDRVDGAALARSG